LNGNFHGSNHTLPRDKGPRSSRTPAWSRMAFPIGRNKNVELESTFSGMAV